MRKAVLIQGLVLLTAPLLLLSQSAVNYNKGGINTLTTAVPFLLITPDARAGGLGDCGVASSADANSSAWNGSKYAMADKDFGMSMSYTPWLRQLVPDISLTYLSGYKKINKNAAVSASLRYFTLGQINFTDVNGNAIGTYKPSESSLDVGYSQKLSPMFAIGLTGRFIYSNLTQGIPLPNGTMTRAGTSGAADLSMYYLNNKIKLQDKKAEVSWGLNISNIGSKISYTDNASPSSKSFIPIQMRLGGGLKIHMDENNSITFLTDLTKLLVPAPDSPDPYAPIAKGMIESFSSTGGTPQELREINEALGMEYWYSSEGKQVMAFRMGYFHEDKTMGDRQFLTFGLGVRYTFVSIDMSYLVPLTQRNPLQNTLQFTLIFDFAAFKKGEAGNETTPSPTPGN